MQFIQGMVFLSENAEFVEMVESCQIKFVGPSAKSIGLIGDKSSARTIAKENHVPIVEGSDGLVLSVEDGLKVARKSDIQL